MTLCTLAAAPAFDRDGFVFRPLAVPSRGSRELALWGVDVAPGAESELHSMDREELFVVVSGQVTTMVAGEAAAAGPGDAVIVPAHALLRVRNSSRDQSARLMAVTSVGMRVTIGAATFLPPWGQ